MPSRKSQRRLSLLRSHRKFFQTVGNAALESVRISDEAAAALNVFGTKGRIIENGVIPTMAIRPRRVAIPGAVLLHMHGGAYVSGNLLQARMLISPIVSAARIPAVTFAYRLAPEYPFPAQLEDALATYHLLLRSGIHPHKIAILGESAGGNLAIAFLSTLRSLGEPLPGALCLLSPWADLLQTGDSYSTLKDIDATLNAPALLASALQFVAGDREKLSDPIISPIYAEFTGFPPTQIHVGDSELLLSDAEALHVMMRRDGVSATLFRWVGMCHVFQVYGFEESRASIHTIGTFLSRTLSASIPKMQD